MITYHMQQTTEGTVFYVQTAEDALISLEVSPMVTYNYLPKAICTEPEVDVIEFWTRLAGELTDPIGELTSRVEDRALRVHLLTDATTAFKALG